MQPNELIISDVVRRGAENCSQLLTVLHEIPLQGTSQEVFKWGGGGGQKGVTLGPTLLMSASPHRKSYTSETLVWMCSRKTAADQGKHSNSFVPRQIMNLNTFFPAENSSFSPHGFTFQWSAVRICDQSDWNTRSLFWLSAKWKMWLCVNIQTDHVD